MFDLIIRDATLVSSSHRQVADVAVREGRIAYVGPRPPRAARVEISAIGKFLLPGVVDSAVHFTSGMGGDWERESAAAVSGGVTTVVGMPGGPDAVVDLASARRRFEDALRSSWCDFALWAAPRNGNLAELSAAHDQGLIAGVVARIGQDVEVDEIGEWLTGPALVCVLLDGEAPHGARRLFDAVRRSGRPLHLLHLSTARELDLVDPLRGDLPVSTSVTPHHLFLSCDDNPQLDSARTSPPLQPEHDRRTLWTAIKRGRVDCVASDHLGAKAADPRGIPGSELLLPLMLSAVRLGRLSLEQLVSMCCEAPARILDLPRKGRIEKGADADLVLVGEGEVARIDGARMLSGAGWSPYQNREAAPKPDMVFVGGQLVAQAGELVVDHPVGRHVIEGKDTRAA